MTQSKKENLEVNSEVRQVIRRSNKHLEVAMTSDDEFSAIFKLSGGQASHPEVGQAILRWPWLPTTNFRRFSSSLEVGQAIQRSPWPPTTNFQRVSSYPEVEQAILRSGKLSRGRASSPEVGQALRSLGLGKLSGVWASNLEVGQAIRRSCKALDNVVKTCPDHFQGRQHRRVEDSGKSYLIYFTTCVLFSNFFPFLAIQMSGKVIFDPCEARQSCQDLPWRRLFVKNCPDVENITKTCQNINSMAKTGGLSDKST